ncbi:MAG: hypothetical protein K0R15_1047 [Clostridiales bacterium]|jgi:hypothetical protein|nr:hypothetical protein [Clostridiales bacterium]
MLNILKILYAVVCFALVIIIVVSVIKPSLKNYGNILYLFELKRYKYKSMLSILMFFILEIGYSFWYTFMPVDWQKDVQLSILGFSLGGLVFLVILVTNKRFVITSKGFGYVTILNRVNDSKFIDLRMFKTYEIRKNNNLIMNLQDGLDKKRIEVKIVPLNKDDLKCIKRRMSGYNDIKPVHK